MIRLNNFQITSTRFPDNTCQMWKVPYLRSKLAPVIDWDFTHDSELIEVAQLKQLLDAEGMHPQLWMPYLPYGRQDKDISNEATFGLHTFAKLLNALEFPMVTCVDAHSARAAQLINHLRVIYPVIQLTQVFKEAGEGAIMVFPDHGAAVKYAEPYKVFTDTRPVLFGEKVREQETGKILSYNLIGTLPWVASGRNVVIVDDICDGGATFVRLAERLQAEDVKDIFLFVSHGIFSKGLRPLRDAGIKRIFTHKGEAFEEQSFITYKELYGFRNVAL